jgi:hypothetical protein
VGRLFDEAVGEVAKSRVEEVLPGLELPSVHAPRDASLGLASDLTLLSGVTVTHGNILSSRLVLLGLRQSSGS